MQVAFFLWGCVMQLGFYIVTELTGEDAQGAAFMAKVKSQMNAAIRGTLYLPPYLRPNQCNIAADSVLFGCLDEITGRGFAMFGKDDADFQYFMDADVDIRKTLNVEKAVTMKDTLNVTKSVTMRDKLDVTKDITSQTGNIKAIAGDVIATTVSLQNHVHQVLTVSAVDAAAIVAAAASGSVATTTMTTGTPM